MHDLAVESLPEGYSLGFYFELHCHEHGDVRVCLSSIEADEHQCPYCGEECDGAFIGKGITRRTVPFSEVVCRLSPLARSDRERQLKRAARATVKHHKGAPPYEYKNSADGA